MSNRGNCPAVCLPFHIRRAEIGAILDDFVSGIKRALDGIQSEDKKRRR